MAVATRRVIAGEDVTAGGSRVIAALETAWRAIQGGTPDLPDVVIITGSGEASSKWGHTHAGRWIAGTPDPEPAGGAVRLASSGLMAARKTEVFIAGERLACGAKLTFQTLLHEATHVLADVRNTKDTSRQGRYHNKTFVKLAEELGLIWPDGTTPDKTIGWSAVVLADQTAERYADVIAGLDDAICLYLALPPSMGGELDLAALAALATLPRGSGGGRSRNLGVATCGCDEPRKVRVAPKTLEVAPIICGLCREEFDYREADA